MLMMVTAFGGYDVVMHAYDVAIKQKYNFGAYGDAMLILRVSSRFALLFPKRI